LRILCMAGAYNRRRMAYHTQGHIRMTAYWPVAAVMHRLESQYKAEIMSQPVMSARTMAACHAVTSGIPACTSLAIIRSEGAGPRRVYLSHPDFEQWTALERGGFME